MIFLRLFAEFFKIGLFAVGGGMATLPFLYDLSASTGWFTADELVNMVAVSESTPGPIGVNMATYVGFTVGSGTGLPAGGIFGALIATLGLITPSVIIILIISGFLKKFSESRTVQAVFYGIRPASVALMGAAMLLLAGTIFLTGETDVSKVGVFGVIRLPSVILCAVLFLLNFKFKKIHPVAFIGVGAVAGILLKL